MSGSKLILVSDDISIIQKVRSFTDQYGLEFEVCSVLEHEKKKGSLHALPVSNSHWSSPEESVEGQPMVEGGSYSSEGGSYSSQGDRYSSQGDGSGAQILPFAAAKIRAENKKVCTMDEMESTAIREAIFQFKGNLTEASKALGIGRATLYRKVKRYNIDTSLARRKAS